MSLLDELRLKKDKLKSCATVVTSVDGCKFLEEKSDGVRSFKKLPGSCAGYVVDTKLDLQIAKVLDYLYLSSQDVAQDIDLLITYRITHVLSIGVNLPTAQSCGIHFKKIELLDEPNEDISKALHASTEFIENAKSENKNNRILVHCNAGYSRAPTIVIGYLMIKLGYSLDKSLRSVKEKRNVKPNEGFIKQLQKLERNIDSFTQYKSI